MTATFARRKNTPDWKETRNYLYQNDFLIFKTSQESIPKLGYGLLRV